MKTKLLLVFFAVVLICGCEPNVKEKWEIMATAKIVSIEIVPVGGFFSPKAIRIWKLDNGMTVSMCDWQKEECCVGDTVIKYTFRNGVSKWEKQ